MSKQELDQRECEGGWYSSRDNRLSPGFDSYHHRHRHRHHQQCEEQKGIFKWSLQESSSPLAQRLGTQNSQTDYCL